MPVEFAIQDLPQELTADDAVEAVYGDELRWAEDKLRQGLSVLFECDKQLVSYLYTQIRGRLREERDGRRIACRFVSGRPRQREADAETPPAEGAAARPPREEPQGGLLTLMVRELGEVVRASEPGTVVVIPHIDLLTTTTKSGLSLEAKEVIATIYENPEVVLLGFKDPEFELPAVVERIFAAKKSLVGIPRDKLVKIITRREARKFGEKTFDPFSLYKYLSGGNAIRVRQILEHFSDRMDYDPNNPGARDRIVREIRSMTLGSDLEIPRIDLDKDVGGYEGVKERLKKDVLTLLRRKDELTSKEQVKQLEELIPRGMIFEGPPGTGKTFIAKAIATAIDATAIVVSGPELKSKWVGESEANLRGIFAKARKSAPAIIIFDELDSFAVRRGTYTGSGVEHSMVNQLLTEMDGFRKEELVFVVGTTNFVEALDEALLRPGRFELRIRIPYPNEKDRRAILDLYRTRFGLTIPEDVFEHIVRKTAGYANVERRMKFTGDHLYAICRGLAREIVRKGPHTITRAEVDETIGDTFEIRPPTKDEEKVIAWHECGHALAAALLPGATPPQKISLEGVEDTAISGYTMHERRKRDHVITEKELLAEVGVLLGGRAAERIVFDDVSGGAQNDLMRATYIAREMIERLGMSESIGPATFMGPSEEGDKMVRRRASDSTEKRIDEEVEMLLKKEQTRVVALLKTHRAVLDDMAAAVLKKRVLEKEDIRKFMTERGFTVDWTEDEKVEAAPVSAAGTTTAAKPAEAKPTAVKSETRK
jgi:cell division protease FtsH